MILPYILLRITKKLQRLNVSDGKEGVQSILDAFEILIVRQRELLNISADAGDEGTNALMSDYVREQEKLVWMYSAFLKKNKII
ncbi:MAG: ferritin-like domain-containing protein [Saprospiraceae bacterium]